MPAIDKLNGIGPAKSKYFENLGVYSISDLLHYYPRTYKDRRVGAKPSPFKKAQDICALVTVLRAQVIPTRTIKIFKAWLAVDNNTVFEATWFKKPARAYDPLAQLRADFTTGQKIWIAAHADPKYNFGGNKIIVDEYYPANTAAAKLHTNAIVPIYGLTEKLTNKFFRELMDGALKTYLEEEPNILPPTLQTKRKLLDNKQALRAIHFPSSIDELERARLTMAYQEFLLLTMAWAIKKQQTQNLSKQHSYQIKRTLLTPFKQNLGFAFTAAQTKVINEIFADLTSPKPMTRLLQGDVGSGKTVVALSAMLLAAENGYQSAFMAPTEILSVQHFITINKYLKGLGLKAEILTSKTTKAGKQKILDNLAAGKTDIIIGTHALIEDNVKFKNLKLIVIDEQHRFGVKQRAALRAKARDIDMLSMTATPIPRTFALAVYGDLDVSTIDELPPGRRPITTLNLPEHRALQKVEEELSKGRQAYIVYPLIDESDKLALKAATQEFDRLRTLMPHRTIAMIHGQMKSDEKQKIMEDFSSHKTDILVATPVIEVGIDVKNASIIVIQNAERFGLASLHQLRGRVGRGQYESMCILVAQNQSTLAKERIDIICQTCDGFKIGEKDLEIRGPGEVLGTRQSGEPELQMADFTKDRDALRMAVEDREYLQKTDPLLTKAENKPLRLRLIELYQKQWNFIDLG